MFQSLKSRINCAAQQEREEFYVDSSSLGEELADLSEWRTGQYGWVTKGGKPGPYLRHVRELAAFYDRHQLLADFMDVGSIASRWDPNEPGGYPEDIVARDRLKAERRRRTRVCLLEYPKDDTETRTRMIENPEELERVVSSLQVETSLKLRLFVVEDLSREVIEALGHHLHIDPSFFRAHIIDSQWDQLDEENRAVLKLRSSIQKQSWHTIRFMRARNFPDEANLKEAVKSAENFNIMRRLKSDNSDSFWDGERRVGFMQSKASLWVQSRTEASHTNSNIGNAYRPCVAVLIIDPSVIQGNPLWRGTRNWTQPPNISSSIPADPNEIPEDNTFHNFIHWAKEPRAFKEKESILGPTWIPSQILLHIICNQWLTVTDYMKARLNQIDWHIAFPSEFQEFDQTMAEMQNRLLTWQRMIPTFREMIQDMASLHHMALDLLMDGGTCQPDCTSRTEATGGSHICHTCRQEWKDPYQLDISRLRDCIDECGDRIDKTMRIPSLCSSMRHKANRSHGQTTPFLRLAFLWAFGPVLACTLNVASSRLWVPVAIPLMLIHVLVYVLIRNSGALRRGLQQFYRDYFW